jgi:hypothetical protein
MRSGHEQRTRSAQKKRAVRKSVLWWVCHVKTMY